MRTVNVPIIESEESHAAALCRIRELWGSPQGSDERGEMETLITLVHAYEELNVVFAKSSPQALVRSVMDSHGLTQLDLVEVFGSQGRVSEFLSGKRPLGKDQAVRLHLKYRLPLELLLGAYDLAPNEAPAPIGF